MYGLIQPVGWVAALLVVVGALAVMWKRRGQPSIVWWARVTLGAAVAFGVVIVPAVAFVPAGHRGIVYEWGGGVSHAERGEGITFLVPWVQNLRLMSVRTQKARGQLFVQTQDLQEITVPFSVNYHVLPEQAAELYQTVGPGYRETVIAPALLQVAKEQIGLVRAEDFARSRGHLAKTIKRGLQQQLGSYALVVEYANVEDAGFQRAFIKAVQDKIIAEQEALKQRNLIAAKAAEKEQVIIMARAEAAAIRIKAKQQAWANRVIERSLAPKVLYWRWLTTWNGSLPTTLVGADKNLTLLLGASSSAVYPYGG